MPVSILKAVGSGKNTNAKDPKIAKGVVLWNVINEQSGLDPDLRRFKRIEAALQVTAIIAPKITAVMNPV
ncbi:hypothetical protein [Roseovarius sp. Pro17]|uniref:hypothetical protein n=1 Tax=Roseovarius sp. Pro17 TaxID=3108175 RepID=UPI002D7A2472|nr:hypothetical protein [Roseovarius sp. Pro17]